jgi:hypothetical protein
MNEQSARTTASLNEQLRQFEAAFPDIKAVFHELMQSAGAIGGGKAALTYAAMGGRPANAPAILISLYARRSTDTFCIYFESSEAGMTMGGRIFSYAGDASDSPQNQRTLAALKERVREWFLAPGRGEARRVYPPRRGGQVGSSDGTLPPL